MDWSNEFGRMWASVLHFLPNVLGAAAVLVIGYVVARLLAKGTDWVLERVRFDQLMARGGVTETIERTGTRLDPSSLIAKLVFWAVMLISISMAAEALELAAVSTMLATLVAYIPNVIAAVLIVAVGFVVGGILRNVVDAATSRAGGGGMLGKVAKGAVITLAVFMALDQLQIAPTIVATAFTLLLGACALAAGLAFGLGGRELASESLRKWSDDAERKARELRGAGAGAGASLGSRGDGGHVSRLPPEESWHSGDTPR
jgi:hypothetical protein